MNDVLGPTGKFPRGKFNDGDEGELKIAVGVNDRTVFLTFGKSVSWIGMSSEDARKMAVYLMKQANAADDIEPFIRSAGDVACEVCGDTYRHHPYDMKMVDHEGHPFLRVRCDGRRLKL